MMLNMFARSNIGAICDLKCLYLSPYYQGRRNVFSFGGAKTKKGTVMSKRAPTVYMRIIITNALMKHYYRHKVSFYMLSEDF